MTRYNEPEKHTTDWHKPLNENFSDLAIEVEKEVATWSDLPSATGETSTNGQPRVYRVNADNVYVRDNGSSWDVIGGVGASSRTMNLQPEGAQTGLAADTTGVKYEGKMRQQIDSSLWIGDRSVYIEAATASSAGDETVTVEIYDDTGAVVADSMTISGGSPRARSSDISGSLTEGNEVHVRWNVSTASATSGATFDAINARLIVE